MKQFPPSLLSLLSHVRALAVTEEGQQKAQREGESERCLRDDGGRVRRVMVMAAVIVTRDGDGRGGSEKRT